MPNNRKFLVTNDGDPPVRYHEQSTQRDAFLASGVVQPMAELNATEGGDFVSVPFWKANLSGDFEVLSDSTSLTPGKITADRQTGVILHRDRKSVV